MSCDTVDRSSIEWGTSHIDPSMRGFGRSGYNTGGYRMGVVLAAVGSFDEDSKGTGKFSDVVDVDFTTQFPFQFDKPVVDNDQSMDMQTFRTLLANAYATDREKLLHDIMAFGLSDDNNTMFIVALTWLWEMHPATFMTVASGIAYKHLLVLISVITFNRSFSMEMLWKGHTCGKTRDTVRASLYTKEQSIWKNLLTRFCVTSNEVVKTDVTHGPRRRLSDMRFHPTLRRDTVTGFISPYVSTPSTPSSPSSPTTTVVGVVATENTCKSGVRVSGKSRKNIWLNEEFKTQWHIERAKLHRREYETLSGVPGTTEDYNALVDFVVCSFATGLTAKDPMAVKWAPIPGGIYDICTKGVLAFNSINTLPSTWISSSGISHAIAYKLHGDLLESRIAQETAAGMAIRSVDAQKRFVVALYKETLRMQPSCE